MAEQLTLESLLASSGSRIAGLPPPVIPQVEQRPLYQVAFADIVIDTPFNRRDDYGDLEKLAEAIQLLGEVPGILLGIAGPDGKTYIADGFRRLAAIAILHERGQALNIQSAWLSLLDVSGCTSAEDVRAVCLATQITANQGRRFNPFEQAKILRDLELAGYHRSEIARLCGLSEPTISERLRLLQVSASTVEFARQQEVSASAVILAARRGETSDVIDQIVRAAADAAAADGRRPGKQDIETAASQVMLPPAHQLDALGDEEKAPSIMQLYEQGYSMARIQKRLHVAWSTVNRVVSHHRREHQFDWLAEQGLDVRRPPLEHYTNYDWARECCNLSREAASRLLSIGPDEIEAVETLQKKPTEKAIRRMTIIYGRWLPGLSSDHLLGIKDFRTFLDDLHRQTVERSATWR